MEIKDIRKQFSHMDKLYHYTKFDTALKIIVSGNLRFGNLYNMNDIHECIKRIYKSDDSHHLTFEKIRNEIYSYGQISLSIDDAYYGFELLHMWGLYAKKATGCCLVFDKNRMFELCNSDKIRKEHIDYKIRVNSDIVCNAKTEADLHAYISGHMKEIFFEKSKLWEHEQEYRLIKKLGNQEERSFLFQDALKYIIMCRSEIQSSDIMYVDDSIQSSPEYKILSNICSSKNIPILFYGNGINGYELISEEGHSIWNERDKYDVVDFENGNWEIDLE